jgi:TolA-binding protein
MTDYERLAHRETGHLHLPRVEPSWTIGTVLAAACSIVSLLSVLVAITWGYARVTYATDNVPAMKAKQEVIERDVAVLKTQQQNGEAKYSEILAQLNKISDKVDRLNDSKADKQMKEWQR